MAFRHRAKRVKHGAPGQVVARFGLGSRAIIYFALAVLMVDLAVTGRDREADQGGALRDLGATPVGTVLLVLFAFGAICYSLWRWAEAALGRHLEDMSRTGRMKAFIEGACYLPFAVMAIDVVLGDSQRAKQANTYRSTSAQFMHTVAGRLLVGAVGVIVVVVGCFLFSEGPRRSFTANLDLDEAPPVLRRVTVIAGIVGATTRGIVFALAGALVIYAAATARPAKAGGIDTALRTVAHAPYGRAVLVVGAVGIAAFGAFALAEARWRRVA